MTPQRRFLLRGSIALAGMLFFWWLALINPLLAVLRVSADLPLRFLPGSAPGASIRVLPDGDWAFRVPVPSRMLNLPVDSRTPKYRGVQLRLPHSSVIPSTLAFAIFWALVLADPDIRRLLRILAVGTATILAIAVAQVLGFIGYTIHSTLHLLTNPFAAWLADYLNYLNVFLIPYATPFCIALWLDRGLREKILTWNAPAPVQAATAPAPAAKRRPTHARKRG